MIRRIFFNSNNFKASSPLRIVDILEARGVWARVIRHVNSHYKPRPTDLVINWGCPPPTRWPLVPRTLNDKALVMVAVDKLEAFKAFKAAEVPCPDFTTEYAVAQRWALKRAVVGRSLLKSFEGRGIAISQAGEEPHKVDDQGRRCKLWTQYIPKKAEYRVHVFNGKVIDVTQKRKRRGVEVNPQVRSWHNGWVYTRENLKKPEGLEALGVKAVQACGLDFGAVDIIWNKKKNQSFVLEVNSAPGLDGQTLNSYATAIQEYVNANR